MYRYLTYFWPENGNCIIFDESNAVLDEIYTFVEEALDAGDSVLIHSVEGDSRACFCASVYFMLKYRWYVCRCWPLGPGAPLPLLPNCCLFRVSWRTAAGH